MDNEVRPITYGKGQCLNAFVFGVSVCANLDDISADNKNTLNAKHVLRNGNQKRG